MYIRTYGDLILEETVMSLKNKLLFRYIPTLQINLFVTEYCLVKININIH